MKMSEFAPTAPAMEGRLEVLTEHRIWGRVPARMPAPLLQIFRTEGVATPAGASTSRAIAAAGLGGHGPTWWATNLTNVEATVSAAIIGIHLFVPFAWEQAT